MYSTGQVVYSKNGRDKAMPFIVVRVEEDYVYLADGKLRRLDKPKKKKKIHVQLSYDVISDIKEKLDKDMYLEDADLRKALKPYRH